MLIGEIVIRKVNLVVNMKKAVMQISCSPKTREKTGKLKKAVSGPYILAPPLSFWLSVKSFPRPTQNSKIVFSFCPK